MRAPCWCTRRVAPESASTRSQPIDPRWAYPKSKAAAEDVIRAEHKQIPYVILRLAGVYDERSMVPTMAQQIARIYERDFQSHFYSGSTLVGQSMLHRDDMLDAFRRTVDRRDVLPPEAEILIGEPDAMGYEALQDELGRLLHGEDNWPTLRVPKLVAARRSLGAGRAGTRHPRRHRQRRGAVHQALHGRHGRRSLRARHSARSQPSRVGAAPPVEGRAAAACRGAQGGSRRLVQGERDHAAGLGERGEQSREKSGDVERPPCREDQVRAPRQPLGPLRQHGPRNLARDPAAADRHPGAVPALERDRPGRRAHRSSRPRPCPGRRSGLAGCVPALGRW